MNNADMPIAFVDAGHADFVEHCRPVKGLTKREYFAGLAMQGLCSDPDMRDVDTEALLAVRMADALLEELERTK